MPPDIDMKDIAAPPFRETYLARQTVDMPPQNSRLKNDKREMSGRDNGHPVVPIEPLHRRKFVTPCLTSHSRELAKAYQQ